MKNSIEINKVLHLKLTTDKRISPKEVENFQSNLLKICLKKDYYYNFIGFTPKRIDAQTVDPNILVTTLLIDARMEEEIVNFCKENQIEIN